MRLPKWKQNIVARRKRRSRAALNDKAHKVAFDRWIWTNEPFSMTHYFENGKRVDVVYDVPVYFNEDKSNLVWRG